jgi:C_GCAxxG_C_C family probable redox protein
MNMNVDIKALREKAEEYYRNGDFYCSEAIVKVIKDEFDLQIGDEIIAAASGFPLGIGGTGCCCGAVAGGVMAIGMIFGRTQAKDEKVSKAMELSKELIEIFNDNHNSICCRVLIEDMVIGSSEHISQCVSFTGDIAEKTAEIILREQKGANIP